MIILKQGDPVPPDARMIVRNADGMQVYFDGDPEVQQQSDARRLQYEREAAETQRAINKQQRAQLVGRITVTTLAGNIFNADETSQQRMARAVSVLYAGELIEWTLANNTSDFVTREELAEALRLAVFKQAQLWKLPVNQTQT